MAEYGGELQERRLVSVWVSECSIEELSQYSSTGWKFGVSGRNNSFCTLLQERIQKYKRFTMNISPEFQIASNFPDIQYNLERYINLPEATGSYRECCRRHGEVKPPGALPSPITVQYTLNRKRRCGGGGLQVGGQSPLRYTSMQVSTTCGH